MKQRRSWFVHYRILIIVLAVIALMTVSVSAYFIKNSGEVKNDFIPADSVTPEIIETFDNNLVKKDVYFNVGNTGYPVYVRARIIITWQNEDGVVYFSEPSEDDYELDLNRSNTGWIKDGDYYYHQTPVNSGGNTEVLIKRCELLKRDENLPDGYTLNVDVLVQTVQAIGYTDKNDSDPEVPAYKDAWNKELSLIESYYKTEISS